MASPLSFALANSAGFCRWALLSAWCLSAVSGAHAAAVLEIPISLNNLVYDQLTAKLYGSATNGLLQVEPSNGSVVTNFPLGTNVTALSLGAGPGIWAVIQGEKSLRRFDLRTLSAEDSIPVFTPPISDIYASRADPQFVVFSSITVNGTWAKASAIRNGTLLPDFRELVGLESVALQGNDVYLVRGGQIYRAAVGPNGIAQDVVTLGSPAGGRIEFVNSYLVRTGGDVLDLSGLSTVTSLPIGGTGRGLAIDADDHSIYLAGSTTNGWLLLSKYSYPGFQLVGVAEVKGVSVDAVSTLAAWGTNHVALNTRSSLFILDTSLLFQPAHLSVLQSVPGQTAFGARAVYEVKIENPGPATAFSVTATNLLSNGEASINVWPYLLPGSSVTYSVEVLPVTTGTLTNTVSAGAGNADTSIAAVTTSVLPITRPVAKLAFAPRYMTYDSQRQRLYFVDALNLWALEPGVPKILGPGTIFESNFPVNALEVAPGGTVFAYRSWSANGEIQLIDSETLATTRYFGVSGGFIDMAPSPAATNVVFVSDAGGGVLYRDRVALGTVLPYSGRAEFADSGTNLYVVNPGTCALETVSVTEAGLVPVSTRAIETCTDFHQFAGLLYFDSGLIIDPATGEKQTNSLNLAPGAVVIPRAAGVLDVVQRVNGRWIAQRFAADRTEVRRVPLEIATGPLQVVPAGENRLALRTSQPALYFVDFDPAILTGRITALTNGSLTFSFDTVPGALYRVETSNDLLSATWTVLAKFTATASSHSETVPLTSSRLALFRLVQLP